MRGSFDFTAIFARDPGSRAAAQFVDRIFVERFDFQHLGDRHVSDFLERAEAFLHEYVRDFLVDVELFHEEIADGRRLFLAFLLRFLERHQV